MLERENALHVLVHGTRPDFGIPHCFGMPMVLLGVGLGTGSVNRCISACCDSELFGRPNSFGLPNQSVGACSGP